MNLNQVTLPVSDMAKATAFYRRLGFLQIVDSPHYARFECPEGESTFSLHLEPEVPSHGVVVYFEHERLDDWVDELKSRGFVFESGPTDERWLWREAVLKDPSGNTLKLYWAGRNRRHPPWRVERRD